MEKTVRMIAAARRLHSKKRANRKIREFLERDAGRLLTDAEYCSRLNALRDAVASEVDRRAAIARCRLDSRTIPESERHWLGQAQSPARRRFLQRAISKRREAESAPNNEEQSRRVEIAHAWLNAPCRWQRAKKELRAATYCSLGQNGITHSRREFREALAATMRDCVSHELHKRGHRLDYRSASGSTYFWIGEARARISDHELGFADYGTRQQIHHDGPDCVFDEDDATSTVEQLADAVEMDCH